MIIKGKGVMIRDMEAVLEIAQQLEYNTAAELMADILETVKKN